MKTKPFILLLALCLPFVGCNKSGKLNERSEFKPPAGPMEFKLKWPVGERVEQEMDMKMKMETAMPGQPAPMKQDITMGQNYGLTVLQANPDGTHEIEMDFLSARIAMKMGGKTMLDYDSTKKDEPGKPNPVGDVFKKIVGAKIRYFLDVSNAVERVEGVEDLVNRFSTGDKSDPMAPMKGMFNEGYFKQMMSANLFIPPKPAQPGDAWTARQDIPMGSMGTMIMTYDFTFQTWEMHGKRNCARFEFQGTIQTKPAPDGKPAPITMSILDGSNSGVSWFDPELGITIDTTMNIKLQMAIQIPQPQKGKAKGGATTMSLTNQMEQAMTVKLVSVK